MTSLVASLGQVERGAPSKTTDAVQVAQDAHRRRHTYPQLSAHRRRTVTDYSTNVEDGLSAYVPLCIRYVLHACFTNIPYVHDHNVSLCEYVFAGTVCVFMWLCCEWINEWMIHGTHPRWMQRLSFLGFDDHGRRLSPDGIVQFTGILPQNKATCCGDCDRLLQPWTSGKSLFRWAELKRVEGSGKTWKNIGQLSYPLERCGISVISLQAQTQQFPRILCRSVGLIHWTSLDSGCQWTPLGADFRICSLLDFEI